MDALTRERDALVKTAHEKRVQHDLDQKLKKPPGSVKDPADMMKGGGFDPNALRRSFSVVGTFSAMGAWGLAAGDTKAERTAKATEKTAKGVEMLIDIVDRKDGPVFA